MCVSTFPGTAHQSCIAVPETQNRSQTLGGSGFYAGDVLGVDGRTVKDHKLTMKLLAMRMALHGAGIGNHGTMALRIWLPRQGQSKVAV